MWSDWLVFCDYGFSVSAIWCPLATPTILLGFFLPWMWGISSRLLQQSAATAPYLGQEVSPHGCPSWPWTWSSSSWPSFARAAAAPDLGRGVAPLSLALSVPAPDLGSSSWQHFCAVRHSQRCIYVCIYSTYILTCITRAVLSLFSHVPHFATPVTVAPQALLSLEFSRQEYWSGLPSPSPGNLPDPEFVLASPAAPAL